MENFLNVIKLDKLKPFNVYAVNQITIALDDGHGANGVTPGKRTPTFPEGGLMYENEFNSRVVDLLKIELERCGFKVILTAPTGADTPLAERVRIANASNADFFLSVHANANTGNWGEWGGIETYTYKLSGDSYNKGKILHKYLVGGTPLRDRGVRDGSHLYVVKNTKMPAVLVECAFMDNLKEARLLDSEAYRQECALELAKGICEMFGKNYVTVPVPVPAPTPAPKPTPAPVNNGIGVVGHIQIVGVKNSAYICATPSSNTNTLGTVRLGETLPISGSVPGWFEVIYNGKRAYVNEKFGKRV